MAKGTNDITFKVGVDLSDVKKKLNAAKTTLHKALGSGKATTRAINNVERQTKAYDKMSRAIQPLKREFAGWAMSLMFAGMAMKRAFDMIWKSSTKAFQDISHSVEGTVTQFDMLEGSMKYLGFVMGAALEPVAQHLVPIVDKISEWVEENPELTASLVVITGVLGTLIMFIGMTKLAIDGFVIAAALAKTSVISLGTAMALLETVTIGIGIVVAIDAIKKAIEGDMWGAISEGLVAAGFMALMFNPALGGAFLTIGLAMVVMNDELKFGLMKTAELVFAFLIDLIDLIVAKFNPIAAFINTLIRAYNAVTGDNIKQLNIGKGDGGYFQNIRHTLDKYDNMSADNARSTMNENGLKDFTQSKSYQIMVQGDFRVENPQSVEDIYAMINQQTGI